MKSRGGMLGKRLETLKDIIAVSEIVNSLSGDQSSKEFFTEYLLLNWVVFKIILLSQAGRSCQQEPQKETKGLMEILGVWILGRHY